MLPWLTMLAYSRAFEPLDTRLRRSLYCLLSAIALQVGAGLG